MKTQIPESHIRSIIKGISWRTIGTIDTMVISWIISGNPFKALKIGFVEVFTKIVLYYFHERVWQQIPLGTVRKITPLEEEKGRPLRESHTRSIIKGISWRILGTIDTITISYFVTGNISDALKIGFTEVFTKIILYYFHERLWQLMPRGSIRRWLKNKLNHGRKHTP